MGKHGHEHREKHLSRDDSLRFVSYWSLLGKVIAAFCLPIIAFTVLLALRLDGSITCSWWIVFSPLFATFTGFILATSSQTLSSPAPVLVRVIWLSWVISVALFVVFLVLRLEENSVLYRPSLMTMFLPLYIGLGLMLAVGIYLFIAGCCCVSPHVQKKYVVSAAPLSCFAIVVLPMVILISFKDGVDNILPRHLSWAVIFIPLFVADAFCFCLGFFSTAFLLWGPQRRDFLHFPTFRFSGVYPSRRDV